MLACANATVSVLRGTSVNGFGDEIDEFTVALSGLPMAISEMVRRSRDESDSETRIVRWYDARCRYGTDIRVDDRIRDEKTGDVYLVDLVIRPGFRSFAPDLHLRLKRVD